MEAKTVQVYYKQVNVKQEKKHLQTENYKEFYYIIKVFVNY